MTSKKKEGLYLTIWPGPFPYNVYFAYDKEGFKRAVDVAVKEIDFDGDIPEWVDKPGHCWYMTKNGHGASIVTVPLFKKMEDSSLAGIIAHEVTHVVDFLYELTGETEPGYEHRAYTTQFLVQEMFDFYKKGNK